MSRLLLVFFIVPIVLLADVKYEIKKGDTLWGISKKFYKNPFKWPVIWKYNTYITNPDLIYPKKFVMIPIKNLEEQNSKEVAELELNLQGFELLTKSSDSFFNENNLITLREDSDSLKYLGIVQKVDDKDEKNKEILTDVLRILKLYKNKQFEVVYNQSLKSEIIHISDDKFNADVNDFVYVLSNEKLNIGDKVTFLEFVKEDRNFTVYTNAGEGIVVSQRGETYQVKVNKLFDSVRKGTKVVKHLYNDFPLPRDLLATNLDKKGEVLALADDMTISGSNYKVVINLGLQDGIKPGDLFKIYRVVEEKGFQNVVEVAEGTVIFSQDRYSTLYILKSRLEVLVSDKVKLELVAVQ
ncbi:MAG: LysM peptidoglycan-binding domain-containing protein [Deferribacterales bacterium]